MHPQTATRRRGIQWANGLMSGQLLSVNETDIDQLARELIARSQPTILLDESLENCISAVLVELDAYLCPKIIW
jgi:hypothetical protein